MTFKVRQFNGEDHPAYKQWLQERGRVVNELVNLPGGVMVYDDENDYAAGFLYHSSVEQCFIGSLASNPHADKDKRSDAVEFLLDHLMTMAKDKGYKTVFATTNKRMLLDRLLKKNFKVYDTNLTQLGMEI